MKNTPYRLFAVISGVLFLSMLLLAIGSLFPGTGIIAQIDSLPVSFALPAVIIPLILTSILAMQGAEGVSRKAGLWKFWEVSLSGAPRWMITALKLTFACVGLAVIIHVIQLVSEITGAEKHSTPLFISLVGMAFTAVNTALLVSIAAITDRNPPSPERLRFVPLDNCNTTEIRRIVADRRAGAGKIIPLIAPALIITAVRFHQGFVHSEQRFSGPELFTRSGAALALMTALFALVYGAMHLLGRYRLVCDTEGMCQARFRLSRRVRWNEIRLIEYQEKRYHDRSGWSPPVIRIHGKSGMAVVVTGDMEHFRAFEKVLGKQLQDIYGVSYRDIQEEGWWGERRNWFLSAGAHTVRFVFAAASYLALITGLMYCAEMILRCLGLSS